MVAPQLTSRAFRDSGICEVCGHSVEFRVERVVSDELARTAGFSAAMREAWDRRESMACPNCRSHFRVRQTARALLHLYGAPGCLSLHQLMQQPSLQALNVLVMADPTSTCYAVCPTAASATTTGRSSQA